MITVEKSVAQTVLITHFGEDPEMLASGQCAEQYFLINGHLQGATHHIVGKQHILHFVEIFALGSHVGEDVGVDFLRVFQLVSL